MNRADILAKLDTLSPADRKWLASLPDAERLVAVEALVLLDAEFVEEPA